MRTNPTVLHLPTSAAGVYRIVFPADHTWNRPRASDFLLFGSFYGLLDMISESAEGSPTRRPLASALLPPPPLPLSFPPRPIVFREPDLENIEDVYAYAPGGHHPVNLGDVFQTRFRIMHKLGNGGFALVWLARDLEQGQYVALKILKANAPDREIRILQYLRNASGVDRTTKLHETFTITGPNGVHQCLVLDLGGPSLKHLTLYHKRPPLSFLNVAARKLAEGLASLHAAGICHGDLTHSNVLFEIPDLQNWTEDELYHYLGRPNTVPLRLLDGKPAPPFAPTHVVDALDYSNLKEEHLSTNVLITDFGEAFFTDSVPRGLGTPPSFSAPELLFGYQPSCAADLWALGCLIFEIHTFRVLVPTIFGSDQEALAMTIETIGALPEEWQLLYYDKDNLIEVKNPGEKHRWFDNQIRRTRTLSSQLLKELPELTQDQHATLSHLLESIMIFEPTHRLPATKVAEHVWFALASVLQAVGVADIST